VSLPYRVELISGRWGASVDGRAFAWLRPETARALDLARPSLETGKHSATVLRMRARLERERLDRQAGIPKPRRPRRCKGRTCRRLKCGGRKCGSQRNRTPRGVPQIAADSAAE
jgi:hypothetical protein